MMSSSTECVCIDRVYIYIYIVFVRNVHISHLKFVTALESPREFLEAVAGMVSFALGSIE